MVKKNIYTNSRCLSTGVLLGRLSRGVGAFERAIGDKTSWSPAYAAGRALSPALSAAKHLERLLPAGRVGTKSLIDILEPWANPDSYGFNREKASSSVQEIHDRLGKVTLSAIEACGKRRPVRAEADALLRLKSAPRRPAPVKIIKETQAPPQWTSVEHPEPEPAETSSETPWAIIAGVLVIIGATFFVGQAS